MCGRYFISKDTISQKVMDYLKRKYDPIQLDLLTTGEVHPSDVSVVYSKDSYELMKWGYQLFSREVINTRIESIRDKDLYREDYQNHKCVIVASGFYEWDKNKVKNYLTTADNTIYLAGIYQLANPMNQFSIITKQAVDTRNIHDRIPVVLTKQEVLPYLNDQLSLEQLISKNTVYKVENNYQNIALF